MDFKGLVKHIRQQGCKVKLYNRKKINNSYGEFDNDPVPHINIATKNSKKRNVATLLHEYGHFLQYREGFGNILDRICWAHTLHHDWVNYGIELNSREIEMIRNVHLAIEYEAEMRGFRAGLELNVDGFNPEYYLAAAHRYMCCIKWSWKNRMDWDKNPPLKYFEAKRLTLDELFAPLTPAQIVKMKKNKT